MASNNALLSGVSYIIKCCNDKTTRSNFNKTLQYATKLASVELKEIDTKSVLAKDLAFASGSINTARKVSQLGNWLEVFNKLRTSSWGSQKEIAKNLADFFNGIFLFFDNFVILNRIKLTDFLAQDNMVNKIAMFGFWWSQFFGLVVEVMEYQALLKAYHKNKSTLTREEVESHRSKVLWAYLGFIARFGNMTYSANGWELSNKALGAPFSEKTCAWAGLIAGVINMVKGAQGANKK